MNIRGRKKSIIFFKKIIIFFNLEHDFTFTTKKFFSISDMILCLQLKNFFNISIDNKKLIKKCNFHVPDYIFFLVRIGNYY